MTYIKTGTGRVIDFLNPDPDQIDLRDIFIALGREHRFGGHSPLKVAQHIIEVASGMMAASGLPAGKERAEVGLVGLVHDFPEFAIRDVPTPLKKLLGDVYATIEDRLLQVMLIKWDLVDAYERHHALLDQYDRDAVIQEAYRYGLDGIFITDDEVTKVPRAWTPDDYTVTLRSDVWDEDEAIVCLTVAFVKLMIQSGRKEYLPAKVFTDLLRGVVSEEWAAQSSAIPPVFLDGTNWF